MAGTNGQVTVPLVTSGVEIDNDQITIAGFLRYRQRTRVAGSSEAELTDVRSTTPGVSDYGLVTRNIPSGTQDVVGSVSISGTVPVGIAPLTSCGSGKTTVTTAGTRVELGPSTVIDSVTVKALASNTGLIYVGNATVAAADGFELSAGDSVSVDVDNLTDINLDASVSGEGVSYLWAT